jgi:hypothetical protein
MHVQHGTVPRVVRIPHPDDVVSAHVAYILNCFDTQVYRSPAVVPIMHYSLPLIIWANSIHECKKDTISAIDIQTINTQNI